MRLTITTIFGSAFRESCRALLKTRPEDLFNDESDRFPYLGEYADVIFADRSSLARISEHGSLLIRENAVETLSKAFSGT